MKIISFLFNRIFLLALFFFLVSSSFGQNGIIGDGFGTANWSTTDNFAAGAGNSRIFISNPNTTGNNYFRLVRNWSSDYTQFGPFGCVDTDWTNPEVAYGMSVCGSGAFFINCPNTTDNYVFKSANGYDATELLYFRVQGAIQSVATVAQYPLVAGVHECHATTITATLSGALADGQKVYLRYTKDAWATSSVIAMSGSDTSYNATIPSSFNTSGANVSYYVFTSGMTTPIAANTDFYTINLNNNGGMNYSYVVAPGGATTAIPDSNFEQVLIDLGLDCSIDGLVFTSNIIDVTYLNVRHKKIANLTGIKSFTSLEKLYCFNDETSDANDNTITSLDVSGLAFLKYLYCQNNQITDLNITGLTSLEALDISNNLLSDTTLNLNSYTNLYYLVCKGNGLTSLDISDLTILETLIVWNNNLSSINIAANTNLKYLDCDDNAFTNLTLPAATGLGQFYCSGNALTSIDLRGLSALTNFECSNNDDLSCILVDDIASANTSTGTGHWVKPSAAFYSNCDCSLITTWNGTSWSNGAPTTGDYAATIAGNYSEAANINACSLIIKENSIVTIPTGYKVTLNAPITVESGSSFTLDNNAFLIQTNKNSINSGNINVKRESSPLFRLDYTLWSSPVTGLQTLANFSPETVLTRFFTYNATTNLYNSIDSSAFFAKGTSYLIRMPDNWGENGIAAAAKWNGNFSGVPNNGDVSLSGLDADKYYAVGNPYPSIINAESFLSGNNTDGVLYFWRKTNGASGSAYATYTLGGATTTTPSSEVPNGKIQVGQGFIVKTGASANKLNFDNSMRESSPISTPFFKTKNEAQKDRIWLNMTSESGVFSQALVGYMEGATLGFDKGYDGKYINDSEYALTSSIAEEEFTIQTRPKFDVTDVVALNFKAKVAGNYSIGIDHVDGLFASNQAVYLVDSKTAIETNLNENVYTFAADSGIDNARFSLKYQKTLSAKESAFSENSISIYLRSGNLYVNSTAYLINAIKVFDLRGKLLAEVKDLNSKSEIISNLKAKNQMLIVKVISDGNIVVSKKILN